MYLPLQCKSRFCTLREWFGRILSLWLSSLLMQIADPNRSCPGTYIDKKCPFTGNIAIRRRILMCIVFCTKMTRTIVVRQDYLHFVPKHQRYEKWHLNLSAHVSPAFRVKEGDRVIIVQCRYCSRRSDGFWPNLPPA